MWTRHLVLCGLILATISCVGWEKRAAAEDPLRMPVLRAIEQAKRYLIRQQNVEGHWEGERHQLHVGVTSLAVIALLNTGMTSQDPEIQKALRWLRSTQTQSTYEISLKIQALSLAKDGKTDIPQIAALVRLLEESQLQNGSWSYFANQRGLFNPAGDRSNAQFAVLGLREAQEAGVPVDLEVWQRASDHFLRSQNRDGGWSYSGAEGGGSTGSMTVAGIATMLISEGMLKAQEEHLNRDGTPRCCTPTPDKTNLAAALRWLGNNFTVKYNPAPNRAVANNWVLYYLYGLERAGRFSGQRFFTNSRGDHFDWYREGAEYLVAQQNRVNGTWQGAGDGENDPIVGTSLALIFLSKGLAPVLFNKIEYGVRDPRTQLLTSDNWNRHPDDVRNLTQHITGLPKWPKLLNWQTVDIGRSTVSDLLQAPIALLTGDEPLRLDRRDLELLREYLDRGGFLLAVNNCRSAAFDESFRDIVRQLYPPSEARLQRLKPDHPGLSGRVRPDRREDRRAQRGAVGAGGWVSHQPYLFTPRPFLPVGQVDQFLGSQATAFAGRDGFPQHADWRQCCGLRDRSGSAQQAGARHRGGWNRSGCQLRTRPDRTAEDPLLGGLGRGSAGAAADDAVGPRDGEPAALDEPWRHHGAGPFSWAVSAVVSAWQAGLQFQPGGAGTTAALFGFRGVSVCRRVLRLGGV